MTKCRYCITKIPDKQCPKCKKCLTHHGCECVPCNKCGKNFPKDTMCPKCMMCRDHHTPGTYIGDEFPLRRCEFKPLPKSTFLVNTLHRRMGIEVEIGELGYFDIHSPQTKLITYNVDRDGSVVPSGIELVCMPLAGDKFTKGIMELYKKLVDNGSKMNDTCGYHVHVDGADLNAADLRKLVVMFTKLQPQIFKYLIDPVRQNREAVAQYCKKLAYTDAQLKSLLAMDSKAAKEWFHMDLYGKAITPGMSAAEAKRMLTDLKAHKAHKYENQARRRALNFHAWMMRGTVEFRCKEGTLNSGDFLIWPLFCGWFVQSCLRINESDLTRWITGDVPDLYDFCCRYMPENVAKWVATKMKR